ncbi:13346_t:CDS:2 [Gigaspora rosea]|nr:13346_t:CDS:2 [Gigaspora rosea]
MDETPVWFDMAGGLTVNPKGSEDHLIYATDDESDEDEIEDFDDGKEEKFNEDNKD